MCREPLIIELICGVVQCSIDITVHHPFHLVPGTSCIWNCVPDLGLLAFSAGDHSGAVKVCHLFHNRLCSYYGGLCVPARLEEPALAHVLFRPPSFHDRCGPNLRVAVPSLSPCIDSLLLDSLAALHQTRGRLSCAGYIGSMAGTLYAALALHSYILSLVCCCLQV